VLWIAFFVIILSIGGFYFYSIFLSPQLNNDNELLASNEKPTTEKITPKPISNTEQNDGSTETASSFESGKEKLKALSNDAEATRFTEDSDFMDEDEQKTFSLILGSFKVERNADKFRQRLQSRGINVEKFRGLKGYYFVGMKR
jgi:cell division septation protein DedD